jgi:hypothetical protein
VYNIREIALITALDAVYYRYKINDCILLQHYYRCTYLVQALYKYKEFRMLYFTDILSLDVGPRNDSRLADTQISRRTSVCKHYNKFIKPRQHNNKEQ